MPRIPGGRLPSMRAHARRWLQLDALSRKDANDRGAEFAGDDDPVLDELDILFARGRVDDGEVVVDAGAADGDPVYKRDTLQVVDVFIGWCVGITGEVIPGGIECIHTLLRAEVDGVREGHGAVAQ